MNLQITDDGKGLKAIAQPVNLARQNIGLPAGESLAWTFDPDPTVGVIQNDPSDSTGLTIDVVEPLKDSTNNKLKLTGTASDGTQVSDESEQFDIVADPKLGGFTFQLSAQ